MFNRGLQRFWLGVVLLWPAWTTWAQPNALLNPGRGIQAAVSPNEPVTFTADEVDYDRERSLVVARGRVEAWQNERVVRADQISFDRITGILAARGNVVLLESGGQVLFADYAEMTRNMKEGILKDIRALLPENGRLAANGARRTDGQVNEFSRVVYSTCDLCPKDPDRAPLWQIQADAAVQDLEHKKIEYYDAVLQMYGLPVAYFPYFFHPDPSVKRESGLLFPSLGVSSHVGAFYSQPYYWVIDDQSDATVIPTMTTRSGPDLNVEYRRRFNNGYVLINPSVGYTDGSIQGSITSSGRFNIDDTWRWGFEVNRASSANYVRNFHRATTFAGSLSLLTSQAYVEGFGAGAYARLDSKFYQSLNGNSTSSRLPLVFPRGQYSYVGRPDSIGGQLTINVDAFNVYRSDGTSTRRARLSTTWERPFVGALGDQWKAVLHNDVIGYDASHLNSQPNYSPINHTTTARALPQAMMEVRWPFMRDSGAWGSQLVEPIAQIIVAPQVGDSQFTKYPNEDSLDFEFSDANLFGFNRLPGVDRLEGGQRANVGLHMAWYFSGTTFDALIGQSYRTNKNSVFPSALGLRDTVSDVVIRGSVTPTDWLDVTYRTRLDKNNLATRMADATATIGSSRFRVSGGYFYSNYNPYTYYDQAPPPPAGSAFYSSRNEVSFGVATSFGRYRLQGYARRDLATNRMVSFGAGGVYEDECFIFDLRAYKRYTSFNNDNGATTVMLLFTLKTIGEFGYRAR